MSQEEAPQVYLKGSIFINICSEGTEMRGTFFPHPLHCVMAPFPSSKQPVEPTELGSSNHSYLTQRTWSFERGTQLSVKFK